MCRAERNDIVPYRLQEAYIAGLLNKRGKQLGAWLRGDILGSRALKRAAVHCSKKQGECIKWEAAARQGRHL